MTETGIDGPPPKRQCLDHSISPYVRNEGAGTVSPVFPSTPVEDVFMTMSRPVRAPGTKPPRSNKNSEPLPIAVSQYHSIEETMGNSSSNGITLVRVSPHLPPKLAHGNVQHSEDSDPEEFTRASEKARHQQRISDNPETPFGPHRSSENPYEKQNGTNTPPPIRSIFTSKILPSEDERLMLEGEGQPKHASAAGSDQEHVNQHTTNGMSENPGRAVPEVEIIQSRTAVKAPAGKKSKVKPKIANTGARTFRLRRLKCGILPEDETYTAKISEHALQFHKDASLLSQEPIWPDIQFSKILKILHGSEDCLQLKLDMSLCQGRSFTKILLEFYSKEDKDDFLSLMPGLRNGRGPLKVHKDEYVDFYFCYGRRLASNPLTQRVSAQML